MPRAVAVSWHKNRCRQLYWWYAYEGDNVPHRVDNCCSFIVVENNDPQTVESFELARKRVGEMVRTTRYVM